MKTYEKKHDKMVPVVSIDEKPVQLLGEVRARIAATPAIIGPDGEIEAKGKAIKIDSEDVRRETASIFMMAEPLAGWRRVEARSRHTGKDFALLLKKLAEEQYTDADGITVVCDNYSTHTHDAFYALFKPSIASCLTDKIRFVYTPVHGSWLNIAECELGVLSMQSLGNNRIPGQDELNEHIKEWEAKRNAENKPVNWQFTPEDARIRFRRLYPTDVIG
ncbi:MAG: transposase [Eubacteriaceae bacterium]|nr:transposase [Eubacteriaceae bacterium]